MKDRHGMEDEREIRELLRRLGVGVHSCGYSYIAYGVALTLRDGSYLEHVTKGLYVDIAHRFGTSAGCVERDIRTAVGAAWRTEDRALLSEVCGGEPPEKRPANREFFRMLHGYFTGIQDSRPGGCPYGVQGDGCPRLMALQDEIGRLREENRRLEEETEQQGMPQ